MNVLEKILEEIEHESKLAHEEMRRCASKNPLQFDEVKGYARGVEYTVDIIRSHMNEAKDINILSKDGWIPVEVRLPKEPKYIEDSYYWDGKEWTDINDELLEGIIAWCPLPEPYRPKEKNNE